MTPIVIKWLTYVENLAAFAARFLTCIRPFFGDSAIQDVALLYGDVFPREAVISSYLKLFPVGTVQK